MTTLDGYIRKCLAMDLDWQMDQVSSVRQRPGVYGSGESEGTYIR